MATARQLFVNILCLFLTITYVASAHAEPVDLKPIYEAFNLKVIHDESLYPVPIFPPIIEKYAHVYPWASIGNFKLAGVPFGYCTAFVVDTNTIATAQHCFYFKTNVVEEKDGFVGRVPRFFRFDPQSPPTSDSKMEYFSNVFGGEGRLWQERLKVVEILNSGANSEKENSLPNITQDWAVVKLENSKQPGTPAMKKLNVSPLSSTQLRALYDKGDIQIFIASYPNTRLIPDFDNSYLRLTAPCFWLEYHRTVLNLFCVSDHGSSGAPIMIRDRQGEVSVIGIVAQIAPSFTYGRRLTLDMLPPSE